MALQSATRTVPIVFVTVIDPVGAGFIESLARPGGNATGFTRYEYGMGGKWLELLKEIDPRVTRVAVLRDTGVRPGAGSWARSSPSRRRLEWSCARSMRAARMRSNAPSPHSRADRTAV